MELNQTLFIQAGIFIAIFFILKKLYFEPVLELLRRRDAATSGKAEEADQMIAQMESMKKAYHEHLKKVRIDLETHRDQQLASLREELNQDFLRAKSKAEDGARLHSEALDREVKATRQKLPVLAQDLKKDILDSITNLKLRSA